MEAHVVPGVMAGLIGGGVVLAIGFLGPRKKCPNCSVALPRVRIPSSAKEAAFGGRVCKACGTKISRTGERV